MLNIIIFIWFLDKLTVIIVFNYPFIIFENVSIFLLSVVYLQVVEGVAHLPNPLGYKPGIFNLALLFDFLILGTIPDAQETILVPNTSHKLSLNYFYILKMHVTKRLINNSLKFADLFLMYIIGPFTFVVKVE